MSARPGDVERRSPGPDAPGAGRTQGEGLATGSDGPPRVARSALAVGGAIAFGAVCCGAAPITIAAIGGIGVAGLVGGVVGAVAAAAAVAGLIVARRARRARRAPDAAPVGDGCAIVPRAPSAPARERGGMR